jgi:hypothetical protein
MTVEEVGVARLFRVREESVEGEHSLWLILIQWQGRGCTVRAGDMEVGRDIARIEGQLERFWEAAARPSWTSRVVGILPCQLLQLGRRLAPLDRRVVGDRAVRRCLDVKLTDDEVIGAFDCRLEELLDSPPPCRPSTGDRWNSSLVWRR